MFFNYIIKQLNSPHWYKINYLLYIQSLVLNFASWLPDAFSKIEEYLLRDIIAGTTIAMIIIPQSMAYATLANLEPINYGLYASLFLLQ